MSRVPRGPSQQMTIRAREVQLGDLAWLPTGNYTREDGFEEDWVRITTLELEGEDVVFNGSTTTSPGNAVVVTRKVR